MAIEIIGRAEYESFLRRARESYLSGTELHTFHDGFSGLMHPYIPNDHAIYLDEMYTTSDFPTTGGIYFCERRKFCCLSEIWYVGKAANFRERWRKHHKLRLFRLSKTLLFIACKLTPTRKISADWSVNILRCLRLFSIITLAKTMLLGAYHE